MTMFQVDDAFLESVGYDLAALSEEQKDEYRGKIITELHARASEELTRRLDDNDALEMAEIAENPARARSWLQEFHSDYRDREEYKLIAANMDSEDDALAFYATALWLSYAVPDYPQIMQAVMQDYHASLVERHERARAALGL